MPMTGDVAEPPAEEPGAAGSKVAAMPSTTQSGAKSGRKDAVVKAELIKSSLDERLYSPTWRSYAT